MRQIIRQLSGKIEAGGGDLIPEVAIQGRGIIYCYAPDRKYCIKIPRGIKGYVVDEEEDSLGRILLYTWTGEMIEIEPEELIYTGFD